MADAVATETDILSLVDALRRAGAACDKARERRDLAESEFAQADKVLQETRDFFRDASKALFFAATGDKDWQ